MKSIIFIFILLTALNSQALNCEVLVITDKEFIEETFIAPVESQGHDVPEMTVTGTNHEVTAMADGKWLGLSWRSNSVLVAESISLIRDVTTQPRVLIMYNPQNTEEQVSINCNE